jgi:hypothetical protein
MRERSERPEESGAIEKESGARRQEPGEIKFILLHLLASNYWLLTPSARLLSNLP